MPYDKSLDVETFKEVKEFQDTRITVGVYSYNDGARKLQLTRENRGQSDEWRFTKLGRLTKQEAQEIIPIMMKAVENM
jgi:hypothetical protein